jgi:hypothetical protein
MHRPCPGRWPTAKKLTGWSESGGGGAGPGAENLLDSGNLSEITASEWAIPLPFQGAWPSLLSPFHLPTTTLLSPVDCLEKCSIFLTHCK